MNATLAVVIAVAALASFAQGITGFGFALIAVPFLVLVVDVREAVVMSTLLGLVNVALLAARLWRATPWRTVGWLLLGSFAGMPLGLAVLIFTPEDGLRLTVGVVTVVLAAALASGKRVPFTGAASELAVGIVSGVLRTSTSMSGPPVVIYLQGRGQSPDAFRAAMTTFFLVGGLISVGAFAGAHVITRRAIALSAAALPGVYLANLAGDRLARRFDPVTFRRLVLALLIATALSGAGSSLQRLLAG
ncbi:MAG TPA: sulfite exporter TauE/SafE family protein [Dehalococcoidia bacterium]|nr:sulfite exporter TauE/SafE family protein [Dehalococcoidia bacterium]